MTDSSTDEDVNKEHVFYRDRSDWKDIQPIPQEEDVPIVAINYSEEFLDVFDYFRAIINKGEKTKRTLELLQDAARLNPANYTVWQYRRQVLKELNEDLFKELDYIKHIIVRQPKNYQVWQHRRVLIEWLNDGGLEKELTEQAIQLDSKNYHAWQHRQWAIKRFNLFEGEFDFIEKLIQLDVRNNSAWNHRYFVINNSTGFSNEVLDREIKYTLNHIERATENESSWNYLRGLVFHSNDGLSGNKMITSFCEDLYASGNRSPFLLSVIIDMCNEQVSKGIINTDYDLQRGKKLCEELAANYDPIRKNYWKYIAENLGGVMEPCGDTK